MKKKMAALLPRYVGHYILDPKHKLPMLEYWPGDGVWADTIHIHIYWRGESHWWLFALPDWLCRPVQEKRKDDECA